MITITDYDGRPVIVDANDVAIVREARSSTNWSLRSGVKLHSGGYIESHDTPQDIQRKIQEYRQQAAARQPMQEHVELFSIIAPGIAPGYHRWVLAALKAHGDGAEIPAPEMDNVAPAG